MQSGNFNARFVVTPFCLPDHPSQNVSVGRTAVHASTAPLSVILNKPSHFVHIVSVGLASFSERTIVISWCIFALRLQRTCIWRILSSATSRDASRTTDVTALQATYISDRMILRIKMDGRTFVFWRGGDFSGVFSVEIKQRVLALISSNNNCTYITFT